MEIIGIIAEYNPFHNGHLYHINKIKEMYPDSLIILALNGYFLERGEISIISKYDKAKIALESGVDLVLAIPTLYGTQSADTFASIAIKILNYFKVNKVIFGSECNDVNKLTNIAQKSIENNENEEILNLLNKGINYPNALSKVINEKFNYLPNDLLGICYIKAIIENSFSIRPITIQRTNDYLEVNSNNTIIGALNIRNKIKNNENIKKYLPANSLKSIKKVDENLYFNILKVQIINNDISDILDVDQNMNNLLKKVIVSTFNINDLLTKIKSKKYTFNRLNRMLVHILLNIKKSDAKLEMDYINIIGFNEKGQKYLNKIKKSIDIKIKPTIKSSIYKYELRACQIYDILTNSNELKKELKGKPIIL